MPKAVLVVFTQPKTPQIEAEYNEWYSNVHLKEVCSLPGIVSARRFRKSTAMVVFPGDYGDYDYLAIYELDTDDIAETVEALRTARPSGRMVVPDVFHDEMTARFALFVQEGAAVVEEPLPA